MMWSALLLHLSVTSLHACRVFFSTAVMTSTRVYEFADPSPADDVCLLVVIGLIYHVLSASPTTISYDACLSLL
jgi:hypothetical protein